MVLLPLHSQRYSFFYELLDYRCLLQLIPWSFVLHGAYLEKRFWAAQCGTTTGRLVVLKTLKDHYTTRGVSASRHSLGIWVKKKIFSRKIFFLSICDLYIYVVRTKNYHTTQQLIIKKLARAQSGSAEQDNWISTRLRWSNRFDVCRTNRVGCIDSFLGFVRAMHQRSGDISQRSTGTRFVALTFCVLATSWWYYFTQWKIVTIQLA